MYICKYEVENKYGNGILPYSIFKFSLENEFFITRMKFLTARPHPHSMHSMGKERKEEKWGGG